jgi:hypothetical protein
MNPGFIADGSVGWNAADAATGIRQAANEKTSAKNFLTAKITTPSLVLSAYKPDLFAYFILQ